jgi:hypothetical protein
MPTLCDFVKWPGGVCGTELAWGILDWDCIAFISHDLDTLVDKLRQDDLVNRRPSKISYGDLRRIACSALHVSDADFVGFSINGAPPSWDRAPDVPRHMVFNVDQRSRQSYDPISDALVRDFTFAPVVPDERDK